MKELYYDEFSIDTQAKSFLEEIESFRALHVARINPTKAALLVIDLQRFFIDRASHAYIPSVDAVIPRIVKLQNYCLQNGIMVIHTRHGNIKGASGMMEMWWHDHLLELSNDLSQVYDKIINPKVHTIIKSQYDAFYRSQLESILVQANIKQLIITGVMTHLCCETTARVAFTKGYEVFFSIDGTATYNHKFHLGSLLNLAHGFAVPMLIDEIIEDITGLF